MCRRVGEVDDCEGAAEGVFQDLGDGRVGAYDGDVCKIALGGVEPGVEERGCVDGGFDIRVAVEDGVDEGD